MRRAVSVAHGERVATARARRGTICRLAGCRPRLYGLWRRRIVRNVHRSATGRHRTVAVELRFVLCRHRLVHIYRCSSQPVAPEAKSQSDAAPSKNLRCSVRGAYIAAVIVGLRFTRKSTKPASTAQSAPSERSATRSIPKRKAAVSTLMPRNRPVAAASSANATVTLHGHVLLNITPGNLDSVCRPRKRTTTRRVIPSLANSGSSMAFS